VVGCLAWDFVVVFYWYEGYLYRFFGDEGVVVGDVVFGSKLLGEYDVAVDCYRWDEF